MRFNSKEDQHQEGIKAPSDGLGYSSQHYRDTVHGHIWNEQTSVKKFKSDISLIDKNQTC